MNIEKIREALVMALEEDNRPNGSYGTIMAKVREALAELDKTASELEEIAIALDEVDGGDKGGMTMAERIRELEVSRGARTGAAPKMLTVDEVMKCFKEAAMGHVFGTEYTIRESDMLKTVTAAIEAKR